jgi:polyisoprenoid-binding protein YceI
MSPTRRVIPIHTALAMLAVAVLGGLSIRAAGPRTFNVEPEQSRAIIDVGKSGAFSFAGHTHEVEAPITTGIVHLDTDNPSRNDVRLEFNAAAMRVTGKGESADDVPKVTQTMLSEMVLDVRRYPRITFESTSVTAKGSAAALDLSVTGRLTIRGTTQAVTAPVAVKVAGDRLTATGKFVVKQTDYGITPISVGGLVKVKNELNITFTIVARERT